MKKDNPDVTREEANAFFEKMHASFFEQKVNEFCESMPGISKGQAKDILLGRDATAILEMMSGALHGMTTSDPTPAPAETAEVEAAQE
jgi:hypothetical protein